MAVAFSVTLEASVPTSVVQQGHTIDINHSVVPVVFQTEGGDAPCTNTGTLGGDGLCSPLITSIDHVRPCPVGGGRGRSIATRSGP